MSATATKVKLRALHRALSSLSCAGTQPAHPEYAQNSRQIDVDNDPDPFPHAPLVPVNALSHPQSISVLDLFGRKINFLSLQVPSKYSMVLPVDSCNLNIVLDETLVHREGSMSLRSFPPSEENNLVSFRFSIASPAVCRLWLAVSKFLPVPCDNLIDRYTIFRLLKRVHLKGVNACHPVQRGSSNRMQACVLGGRESRPELETPGTPDVRRDLAIFPKYISTWGP
jgi:hypothetical protein